MQEAYRILYNVNGMTIHWAIRPHISRPFLTIRYGNAIVVLVVDEKGLIGRHDHKIISAKELYNFIDKFNESLRLGHGGLFEH